jgi:hypothetical protein
VVRNSHRNVCEMESYVLLAKAVTGPRKKCISATTLPPQRHQLNRLTSLHRSEAGTDFINCGCRSHGFLAIHLDCIHKDLQGSLTDQTANVHIPHDISGPHCCRKHSRSSNCVIVLWPYADAFASASLDRSGSQTSEFRGRCRCSHCFVTLQGVNQW